MRTARHAASKALALLLAFILATGPMPISAYADEPQATTNLDNPSVTYGVIYDSADGERSLVFQSSSEPVGKYGAAQFVVGVYDSDTLGQVDSLTGCDKTYAVTNGALIIYDLLLSTTSPKPSNVYFDEGVTIDFVTILSFTNCSYLKNVYFRNLDAPNLSSMDYMFSRCSSLDTVSFAGIVSAQPTDMNHMFTDSGAQTIDLTDLDTSQVTDVGDMFNQCSKLKELNLSSSNFGRAKNKADMFFGCATPSKIVMGPEIAKDASFIAAAADYWGGGPWIDERNRTYTLETLDFSDSKIHTLRSEAFFEKDFNRMELSSTSATTRAGENPIVIKRGMIGAPENDPSDIIWGSYLNDDEEQIAPGASLYSCFSENNEVATIEKCDQGYLINPLNPGATKVWIYREETARFCPHSVSFTITVLPARIPLLKEHIDAIPEIEYTGEPIKPAPTVCVDGTTLTEGTDYAVTYAQNTNAGLGKVIVTGINDYTGTVEKEFVISPRELDGIRVDDIPAQIYNGKPACPSLTLQDSLDPKAPALQEGTDYIIEYSNNESAGTATATITGIGNYTGVAEKQFSITPCPLLDESKSYIYVSGTETFKEGGCSPYICVAVWNSEECAWIDAAEGTDYSVQLDNNNAVGTATATITGIGSFAGTVVREFEIKPAPLPYLPLIPTQTYTGAPVTPAISITTGGVELIEGKDYTLTYRNNIEEGQASVVVTGKGNYEGTAERKFAIAKTQLPQIPYISAQTYTGSPVTPQIVLIADGRELVEGTDYTLDFYNNIQEGTATVVATGRGVYTGTVEREFAIRRIPLYSSFISSIAQQTYNGTPLTPAITVKNNEETLLEGIDYVVEYQNNVNAGTAKVTITGIGSYSGTATKTFAIARRSIARATFSPIDDQAYTGSPIKPSFSLSLDGITLTPGTDYDVSYSRNQSAGQASITVQGLGNYTGSASTKFTITDTDTPSEPTDPSNPEKPGADTGKPTTPQQPVTPAQPSKPTTPTTPPASSTDKLTTPISLSKAAVTIAPKTYTGKKLTPSSVTVTLNGKTLRKGTDYTVSCAGGKNVGSYKVTITGKGAYTGSKTATFTINPKGTSISKVTKAKRGFTLKWKKPSKTALKQITGYQVRWSLKSNMTGAKTKSIKATSAAGKICTLKVSKLKGGKKYYVQVRNCKKVGKKTYYSAWSKAKAVKTKK